MKTLFLVLALLASQGWAAATATPTSTFTPTPVFVLSSSNSRTIVVPQVCLQSDGITTIGATALPGATSAWLAQTAGQTALVLSTGSAAVRFQWVVPNDYEQQGLKIYGRGFNSTLTNTVQVVVNTDIQKFNRLTSTAVAFLGTTTNVQTQNFAPLQDAKMSRFYMPTHAALLTRTAGRSPIAPGDLVNFFVRRTGTDGNLNVFALEIEYNAVQGRKP